MLEKGKNIITTFQKKWKAKIILSHFVFAIAAAILLSTLLHQTVLMSFWISVPIFLIIFLLLLLKNKQWKITERDVSGFLNQYYPEVQESSHLILKPSASLNLLEKMQAEKVEKVLLEIKEPEKFNQKFKSSVYVLLFALALSFIVFKLPFSFQSTFHSARSAVITKSSLPVKPEKILTQISEVDIKIFPPAYIHIKAKEQANFNLVVEEGAEVVWQILTNMYVKNLKLLFNDKQVLNLTVVNKERTAWRCRKIFTKSCFYQVIADNKVSEYYKAEIIKDLPPVIRIQSPAPHTAIDFGMPEKIMLTVALSDDYGIKNTSVSATISSGSGEAVKFKEQQLLFSDFKAGATQYNLRKLIDLKALGMQPGDELYFYVRAADSYNQEKKSDVYIVSLPDTAQLMSMEGMATGINIKPEYFRSERQIIIETEQLIKDKDTISIQDFNNRSNNLGIDQKLLRLRYGKFLGEESENDSGEHDDHSGADHNEASEFGNAAKATGEHTHNHDNAEDATFFEPELKAQLKATLTEMWKAELQLRINKPREALPFEYKALRLLKDLQQKSRVYVAKTGFKSTPLETGKRLTGDLSKITEPINRQEIEKKKKSGEAGRKAIGLLEMLQAKEKSGALSIETLREAGDYLTAKAVLEPSLYLPAAAAMKRILTAVANNKQVNASDIATAETGLQKMLSEPPKSPSASSKAAYESLSVDYFKMLNRRK